MTTGSSVINKWVILPVSGPEDYDEPKWACVLLSPELVAWLRTWRGIAMALATQKGFYCVEFFSNDAIWFDVVPEPLEDTLYDYLPIIVNEYPGQCDPMETHPATTTVFRNDGNVFWMTYLPDGGGQYESGWLPAEVFFDE